MLDAGPVCGVDSIIKSPPYVKLSEHMHEC